MEGRAGGQAGRQAGKRKKERKKERKKIMKGPTVPPVAFQIQREKQRTEKDTRFKMGIWKDGHPLGRFIQHPSQQKGIVSLFLSTWSFQTSETLRGGFLSPWPE
jgi:hypothetical protein